MRGDHANSSSPRSQVRQMTLLGLQVVLAATLFGLLLLLAERHNRRFDLTPTQAFQLSDGAVRVAKGVSIPLRILAFYNSQDSDGRRQMEDLLELFAAESSNITYRMADLDRSPALAKRYGVSSFGSGIVEIDGGEFREIRAIDEEELTNAILKMTRRKTRNLCFLTVHGERSPQDADPRHGYSTVAKAMEKENFQILTLDSVLDERVSEQCSILLVAGPRHDFLPAEADQFLRYLEHGGRALLLLDSDAPPGFAELLQKTGIRVGNNVVVDERNRLYGADSFMARVPIFAKELFGNNLDSAAVFPVARSIDPAEEPPPGLAVLRIALTSDDSYAREGSNEPPDGEFHFRPESDHPGPLTVGVMAASIRSAPLPLDDTQKLDDARNSFGQLIVLGDADFASNLYLNVLGNRDLFASCLGVLAEDNDLIAVRRKRLPSNSLSPIYLTADQGRTIFWVAVVLVPGSVALAGILVAWRRRKRASRQTPS